MNSKRIPLLVLVLMGTPCLGAAAEIEIPLTMPLPPGAEEQFSELLENSPFTRSLNMPNSVLLTGVADIEGKTVATLLDPKTNESYLVSENPDANGWRLVGVEWDADLEKVIAKVMIAGGEVVTVRFDESQLRPEKGKSPGGDRNKGHQRPDHRPPPTDEDRRKFGEYVRGRMAKMTEEQRRKVGEITREKNLWRDPNLSDRQKGETFIKIMNHVENEGKKR